MSSNDAPGSTAAEGVISAQDLTNQPRETAVPSGSAEAPRPQADRFDTAMTSQVVKSTEPETRAVSSSPDGRRTPRGPVRMDTTTALAQARSPPTTPPTLPASPSQMSRKESTAIGPSSDQPDILSQAGGQSGPSLQLVLLLTNGARHPFILDPQYLAKRSVEAQGNDPFNLSVYKLKELILREWRDEWEQKPTNPSNIRLISFGKLLDDKAALKDQRFNREGRNVVHMTIKPQDIIEDDDGKGAKTSYASGRAGEDGRSPGCRCTVM